uniref:Glutamyl-tRNA reductase n=1 Tax=Eubacterium cellulosolvens (strain ATCC 43171 / JCM 9499 / 6) TaxID=633697 RepID=I5AWY0_EUBC6
MDHRTASARTLSRWSFLKEEQTKLMKEIRRLPGVDGVVMLNTCNRVEFYLSIEEEEGAGDTFMSDPVVPEVTRQLCPKTDSKTSPELDLKISPKTESETGRDEDAKLAEPVLREILRLACQMKKVSESEILPSICFRQEREVVRHLFSVASGLESAIFAEDQIVTQVDQAVVFSRSHQCIDRVLEVLFRMAITCGKKVRTEVHFTRANATAMDAAVRMLKKDGYDLTKLRCMVIGNGAYGKLAAETLKREGAEVTVTVREYHSGHVEIPKNCRRISYGERYEQLKKSDLVVSATASPHYTITAFELEKILQSMKDQHPLIFLDMAIPRDVDPAISDLAVDKKILVYGIEDFHSGMDPANVDALKKALRIMEEIGEEFRFWYRGRDVVAAVGEIKKAVAEDLQARIQKKVRKLEAENVETDKLLAEIRGACERTVGKMLFELQDRLHDRPYRETIDAIHSIYFSEEFE